MRDINELFIALGRSEFRRRFRLSVKEADYLRQNTLPVILEQGRNFVISRLAAAFPHNDGRQTPMKNHPVFIAQHATGTCCRKCLEKWHNIRQGQQLTAEQIEYVVCVIERWLKMQNI